MLRKSLDLFFNPRSVVIIGLSRSAVGSPISILTSLESFGYEGELYVVNPRMPALDGVTVCKALDEVPREVDLALVSVERSQVVEVVEACAAHGIRAAIVITQGFADADEIGGREQQRLEEVVARTGIRILGPNTIGLADASSGFTSSFIEIYRERESCIGQVAQSGFLMMGNHLINNEPAGFLKTIDLGNACDVGLIEVLEYFEHDEGIGVIECHLEAIQDGRAFLDVASRISRRKPIVALKAGTSALGLQAVASHTGAVAGESRVYGQALRQAGVVQAESAEELRLLSKAFETYGKAEGRRVAVVSFSGGGAVLALDAIDRAGLELAELAPKTLDRIRHLFPEWLEIGNPLDIWIPIAKDMEASFPLILESVLDDPSVDAVICIYCSYNLPKYGLYDVSPHIARLADERPGKPILGWSYGQDIEGITKAVESSGKAMVFPTLEGAATALAHLADHGERISGDTRRETASTVEAEVDRDAIETVLARAGGAPHLFTDAFEILEAYGLPVVPWTVVREAGALDAETKNLRAPFCLKVVSEDILHKSDSGGVVLGVGDGEALGRAFRNLRDGVPAGARLDGILVQEMAAPGTEVMIGMVRDPSFGPCVVFGAGGIYAELLDDVALRVAPVDEGEAREMIMETKVAKLIGGARGKAAADIDALVRILTAISRFAVEQESVREIDLNPVIVGPEGAAIVDVRFIMAGASSDSSPGHEARADVG